MRLAFLSDIHGNLPALHAVWRDLRQRNIDRIICAGDLVSFGPHPAEVVDFFIENQIETVLGNHDAVVTGKASVDDFVFDSAADRAYVGAAIARTIPELGARHLTYLASLPLEITIPECSVVVTHCVPDMFERPDSNAAEEYMAVRPQRFLLFGHTHLLQVYALRDGKMAINIPSVGKPRHGDPLAGYCIAEIVNQQLLGVQFYFCEYNRDAVCKDIILKEHPTQTLRFLSDTQPADFIQNLCPGGNGGYYEND